LTLFFQVVFACTFSMADQKAKWCFKGEVRSVVKTRWYKLRNIDNKVWMMIV
jgi:hypothetical protein